MIVDRRAKSITQDVWLTEAENERKQFVGFFTHIRNPWTGEIKTELVPISFMRTSEFEKLATLLKEVVEVAREAGRTEGYKDGFWGEDRY